MYRFMISISAAEGEAKPSWFQKQHHNPDKWPDNNTAKRNCRQNQCEINILLSIKTKMATGCRARINFVATNMHIVKGFGQPLHLLQRIRLYKKELCI